MSVQGRKENVRGDTEDYCLGSSLITCAPPAANCPSLLCLVLLSVILSILTFCLISFRYRLSVGTNEKIQLSSLIAAFQVTRDLIVTEA